MIRIKKNVHPTRRRGHQIILLPSRTLKRKRLSVIIVIMKVTPYNIVTKRRTKIGKRIKIIKWFVCP
jgi:hypothetical protein